MEIPLYRCLVWTKVPSLTARTFFDFELREEEDEDGFPPNGPDPYAILTVPDGSKLEFRPYPGLDPSDPHFDPSEDGSLMLVLPTGEELNPCDAFGRFGDPALVRGESELARLNELMVSDPKLN